MISEAHSPTRRTLLGGAAVAAAGGLLAACSPRTASPPAAAGEPRRGGELVAVFAGGGAQETLDPHRSNLFLEASRSKMLFEKLADFGDDMSPQPRLAESWEPSTDLRSWTIRLREGATWHDGRPVRGEDVLYSLRRITDPDEGFRARSNFASLDLAGSRVVDARTVELRLSRPYAEFPNSLTAFGAFIVPEHHTDFTRPVGSGPFRFADWTPGTSLRLTANDGHWEQRPWLDGLRYLIANEESARINALISGTAHYAHDISAATLASFRDRPEVVFTSLPGSGMNCFAMKTDRAPFDDPDARRAMFSLCQRQELVDAALGGAGRVANDLFGRGYQHYADAIPQRTQDLALAEQLVTRSGLRDATVTIDTADVGTGMIASASVLAEQLGRVGVRAEVRTREASTYWSDVLDQGQICAYRSGSMPIESHIAQRLLSDSPTNATRWADAEFDGLYREAVITADDARRDALYRRLQAILHDRGGFLIWGEADWIVASAPQVGGIATAPANSLDWARFDTVWLG